MLGNRLGALLIGNTIASSLGGRVTALSHGKGEREVVESRAEVVNAVTDESPIGVWGLLFDLGAVVEPLWDVWIWLGVGGIRTLLGERLPHFVQAFQVVLGPPDLEIDTFEQMTVSHVISLRNAAWEPGGAYAAIEDGAS
jgi:hypothetical protein